ncbi:hypothetical protein C0J52_20117 [Blattella germanica]|nr:hypothetical protein C0J52_20117 [Blattella germanica]
MPANLAQLRHRITVAVQEMTPDMLQRVWQEIYFRWDVCRMNNNAHIDSKLLEQNFGSNLHVFTFKMTYQPIP